MINHICENYTQNVEMLVLYPGLINYNMTIRYNFRITVTEASIKYECPTQMNFSATITGTIAILE